MDILLKFLSRPVFWLTILFILFLGLKIYLVFPFYTLEYFKGADGSGHSYGFTTDLIPLIILPIAIWFFAKKTRAGWVLIVTWLLMSILLAAYYFYNTLYSLEPGADSWKLINLLEIIVFVSILTYLLTPKNIQGFKLDKRAIVLAFFLPFILCLTFYIVITI